MPSLIEELQDVFPFNLAKDIVPADCDFMRLDARVLISIIEILKERDRKAIMLRYHDHMTFEKIASELGLSYSYTKEVVKISTKRLSLRARNIFPVSYGQFLELDRQNLELEREIERLKSYIGYKSEPELVSMELDKDIRDFELTVRTQNVLHNAGIGTLRELVFSSQATLERTRNCGRKSIEELKQFLETRGLHLGMTNEEFEDYIKHTTIVLNE